MYLEYINNRLYCFTIFFTVLPNTDLITAPWLLLGKYAYSGAGYTIKQAQRMLVQCSPTTAPLVGGNFVQTLPSGVATWPTIGMGTKMLDKIYKMH